ncbi:MAG: hypoxanthine-guanine phosphoribosyltransferase, partial [Lysobacterales bacterium CG02_land_8_20_14_3_00_62_12]
MIPAGAERLVDQAGVAAAYDRLGRSLNQALPEGEILMLPVMNGGIFAVCELARRIDRPMRFDYVHATRYRGETRGREVQ